MRRNATHMSPAMDSQPMGLVSVSGGSDSTAYDPPLVGFCLATDGNVAVIAGDDTAAVTLPALKAGVFYGMVCTKVMATNTTATGIIGFR